jgi:molybdopterin synthase catalytic subunit
LRAGIRWSSSHRWRAADALPFHRHRHRHRRPLAANCSIPGAGGYVSFEGWVRDFNEGQDVTRLEYEAFQALAVKEGERILAEALQRFPIKHALCIHRVGSLDLTDMAVWVGVSSAHRGEAFDACRYIIDEVKHRVPIWKKEHYRSGDSGWVNCERCAAPAHAMRTTRARCSLTIPARYR